MNTPAPTQRIQTTYALGIALLISGATSASQRTDSNDGPIHRQGYETYSKETAGCATLQQPRVVIFDNVVRQSSPACTEVDNSASMPPAVRLARPLSGRSHSLASENIRYSF